MSAAGLAMSGLAVRPRSLGREGPVLARERDELAYRCCLQPAHCGVKPLWDARQESGTEPGRRRDMPTAEELRGLLLALRAGAAGQLHIRASSCRGVPHGSDQFPRATTSRTCTSAWRKSRHRTVYGAIPPGHASAPRTVTTKRAQPGRSSGDGACAVWLDLRWSAHLRVPVVLRREYERDSERSSASRARRRRRRAWVSIAPGQ